MGALEASRWAYTLHAYDTEESAASFEYFFNAKVRRATSDHALTEIKLLWLAALWRVAVQTRKGDTFKPICMRVEDCHERLGEGGGLVHNTK